MIATHSMLMAAVGGIILGASGCAKAAAIPDNSVTAPVAATAASEPAKHACKGQNACKGQGGCKAGKNGCKGRNDCKGQGGCKTA
jgi:hypothetical protein